MALPPESRVVTVILQSLCTKLLVTWGRAKGVTVEDFPEQTRSYPDIALHDGPLGTELVAVDVKSARYLGGDKVSRMTLGTYDGYFLHPAAKRLHGGTRAYDDYSEHWVVGVIYQWSPKADTIDMVRLKGVVVGEKWQVASRQSGSGDTANIGGIDSLSRLETLRGEFADEDEFLRHWRSYAVAHPRRRTRAPDSV
jgi:hypothetical protein